MIVDKCRDKKEDICWLKNRTHLDMTLSDEPTQQRTLSSPMSFRKKFLCVTNVSLNCPRRSVRITSTAGNNWPNGTDGTNPGCKNYVAFITNNSKIDEAHRFCGCKTTMDPGCLMLGSELIFQTVLDSDSFLAVMWTKDAWTKGKFEFHVTCNEDDREESPKEGSGRESLENILTF